MKLELTFKTTKGKEVKKIVNMEKPILSLASLMNTETILKVLEIESKIYAEEKERSIITNIKDVSNH